jgi:hypothetical protein
MEIRRESHWIEVPQTFDEESIRRIARVRRAWVVPNQVPAHQLIRIPLVALKVLPAGAAQKLELGSR